MRGLGTSGGTKKRGKNKGEQSLLVMRAKGGLMGVVGKDKGAEGRTPGSRKGRNKGSLAWDERTGGHGGKKLKRVVGDN